MTKKVMWIIVIVVVLVSGWYFFFQRPKKNGTTATKIETYTVQRGDFLLSVSADGTLTPAQSLDITSEVSGNVIWIINNGINGIKVKKGDILVKIDPTDYQNAFSQAQLNYRNAELKLQQSISALESQRKQSAQDINSAQASRDNAFLQYQRAKTQYENSRRLYKSGGITLDQLETDRTTYETALNSYNQAEANLKTVRSTSEMKLQQMEKDVELAKVAVDQAKLNMETAKQNLDNTQIRAPFSGVVANVNISVGQRVVANNTVLLSVLDPSNLELDLEVDETDIPKVSVGLPVRITTDAFPNDEFSGKVKSISPNAKIVNNIPIFDVLIGIPNTSGKLRSGMSATGEIILTEKKNVLLVPLKAVKRVGRRAYVEVLKDGKVSLTRVTLGEDDGTNVIVKNGLEEGMQVVLTPNSTVARSIRAPNMFLFGR
ncbi:MAG: efflux RND transporter periplasmic adaptor subunit [bacterium]